MKLSHMNQSPTQSFGYPFEFCPYYWNICHYRMTRVPSSSSSSYFPQYFSNKELKNIGKSHFLSIYRLYLPNCHRYCEFNKIPLTESQIFKTTLSNQMRMIANFPSIYTIVLSPSEHFFFLFTENIYNHIYIQKETYVNNYSNNIPSQVYGYS